MSCCAKCRRGTAALGEFPCGLDGYCQCHQGVRFTCGTCGKTYPVASAAETCEQVHQYDGDVDMTVWGD